MPTFTDPVTFGTDTAVNSFPGSSGDGEGLRDGAGFGVDVGFGDGVGFGNGEGFGATAAVCAEVTTLGAYPDLEAKTRTDIRFPSAATASPYEESVAPAISEPSTSHW